MGDIVNLHRVRKRMARSDAEQTAAARRLEFGRSKAQRKAQETAAEREEKSLDGHRMIREEET